MFNEINKGFTLTGGAFFVSDYPLNRRAQSPRLAPLRFQNLLQHEYGLLNLAINPSALLPHHFRELSERVCNSFFRLIVIVSFTSEAWQLVAKGSFALN